MPKDSDDLVLPDMRNFVLVVTITENDFIHYYLRRRPNFDTHLQRESTERQNDVVDEVVDVLAWLLMLKRLNGAEEGEVKRVQVR